ncbi:hypothetical protein Q6293_28795, partial [Klebsiella pneumoniae]|uniref:hypothetical protein n=1 Tax=Klebsiella pneumoniae TaxID=573 RepID=UPI0027321820
MKETSFEEALANQRKEMAKSHHQKVENKKKEKTVEKKGKTNKKEEKKRRKTYKIKLFKKNFKKSHTQDVTT